MTGFVSSHWLPSNRRIRHIFNTTKKNKWFRCEITLWWDTSCYGLGYVCFSHTAEPACGLVGKYRSACGDLFMGTGSTRQWPDSFMTSCTVRRWGHSWILSGGMSAMNGENMRRTSAAPLPWTHTRSQIQDHHGIHTVGLRELNISTERCNNL